MIVAADIDKKRRNTLKQKTNKRETAKAFSANEIKTKHSTIADVRLVSSGYDANRRSPPKTALSSTSRGIAFTRIAAHRTVSQTDLSGLVEDKRHSIWQALSSTRCKRLHWIAFQPNHETYDFIRPVENNGQY